ncbi:MAG: septal ring lytic transglycosylase RlpA family lipoprotein [Gammaproteobacteria bacterium CG22_combo_CG10-13_8_21_14_all_40_8]|nr:MAG: septal ring lytic transglycosylase RlpA family lipoprotein [Gammaproteobacteria bacterium CG22_combo_CG10-13_8_21_14_all_40_8]
MLQKLRRYFVMIFVVNLMGCISQQPIYHAEKDSGPTQPVDVSHVQDAVPKVEPRSRYGNPDYYEIAGLRYFVLNSSVGFNQTGNASWYGRKFHGKRTSSGEPYDMYSMTAAHKTLPLPTYVEVVNLQNGKKIIVKVNDRGPFHPDRIIDLSYAAAKKLDFINKGTALVSITALQPGIPESAHQLSTGYLVQFGAFSDNRAAQKMALTTEETLKQKVDVVAIQLDGNLLYRVRLGPFSTKQQAILWIEKALSQGIDGAKLVTMADKWHNL